MILGIGGWWDPLAWKVGIDRSRPLKAMREYVEVLRRLFRMETVTFDGDFVKVREIRLDVVYGDPNTPRKIPIYIGATGWQMMELTGEVADGRLTIGLVGSPTNESVNININGKQQKAVSGDVIHIALDSLTSCQVGG